MNRNVALASVPRIGHGFLPGLLRALSEAIRLRRDAARLDQMPRERLMDMGITPRTGDNARHSGEAGTLSHRASSW